MTNTASFVRSAPTRLFVREKSPYLGSASRPVATNWRRPPSYECVPHRCDNNRTEYLVTAEKVADRSAVSALKLDDQ